MSRLCIKYASDVRGTPFCISVLTMRRIYADIHFSASRQRPCARHTPPDPPCRSRAPIGLIGRKYRDAVPPPGDPRKAFANLNPNTLPRKRILLFGMTFFLCIRRRAGLLRESESTVRKTHAECAKSVGKAPDINISLQIFTPNAAPDRTASSESRFYSIRAFPYCKIRQSML